MPRILDLEKLFARLAPVFVNGAQGFGISMHTPFMSVNHAEVLTLLLCGGIRQYAEVGLVIPITIFYRPQLNIVAHLTMQLTSQAVQDSVRDGYRLPDLISKIAEQGNSGKAGKVSQATPTVSSTHC